MKSVSDMLEEIEKKYSVEIRRSLICENGEKVPFYSVISSPGPLSWNAIIFGSCDGWRENNNKELRRVLKNCEQRRVFVTRIFDAILGTSNSVLFDWLRIEDGEYLAKVSIGGSSVIDTMKNLVNMGYAVESVSHDAPFFYDYCLRMPVDGFEEIMGLLGY